jgi:predicted nucleotidyltransferase/DNA-binding XRE family transcriptional regulator
MPSASAAAILREARLRSAQTQTELANHAGVAQSVISAYESGRREPSLDMLRRLVAASGFELNTMLSPSGPNSPLRSTVELHRTEVRRTLVALGAKKVRLFGSVARGDEGPDSDIDLLVDIRPDVGLFGLGRMRSEAERIFGAKVDLVPANSLKLDVAERVFAEAVPL